MQITLFQNAATNETSAGTSDDANVSSSCVSIDDQGDGPHESNEDETARQQEPPKGTGNFDARLDGYCISNAIVLTMERFGGNAGNGVIHVETDGGTSHSAPLAHACIAMCALAAPSSIGK
jgi:hypothetical protein